MVLTTVPLAEKELDAFEGWAEAMDGYPIMAVPNKVPRVPPAAQTDRLGRIAARFGIPVTTFVPYSTVFERRIARTALCSSMRPSVKTAPLIDAFINISAEVLAYAARVA